MVALAVSPKIQNLKLSFGVGMFIQIPNILVQLQPLGAISHGFPFCFSMPLKEITIISIILVIPVDKSKVLFPLF